MNGLLNTSTESMFSAKPAPHKTTHSKYAAEKENTHRALVDDESRLSDHHFQKHYKGLKSQRENAPEAKPPEANISEAKYDEGETSVSIDGPSTEAELATCFFSIQSMDPTHHGIQETDPSITGATPIQPDQIELSILAKNHLNIEDMDGQTLPTSALPIETVPIIVDNQEITIGTDIKLQNSLSAAFANLAMTQENTPLSGFGLNSVDGAKTVSALQTPSVMEANNQTISKFSHVIDSASNIIQLTTQKQIIEGANLAPQAIALSSQALLEDTQNLALNLGDVIAEEIIPQNKVNDEVDFQEPIDTNIISVKLDRANDFAALANAGTLSSSATILDGMGLSTSSINSSSTLVNNAQTTASTFSQQFGQAIANQVSDAIKNQLAQAKVQNGSDIIVRLDPAELGRVNINFTFDAASNGVQANITADNSAAILVLRERAELLATQLRQNGFENVELKFDESQSGSGFEQNFDQQGSQFDRPDGDQNTSNTGEQTRIFSANKSVEEIPPPTPLSILSNSDRVDIRL